jgi:hypothetical protein
LTAGTRRRAWVTDSRVVNIAIGQDGNVQSIEQEMILSRSGGERAGRRCRERGFFLTKLEQLREVEIQCRRITKNRHCISPRRVGGASHKDRSWAPPNSGELGTR